MNEWVMKAHLAKYPRSEPVDAVKLCYQSAFGCGHLITDPAQCAKRLREELAATPEDPSAQAFESIGGGMARLNLACPEVRRFPPEELCRLMMLTVERTKPSKEAFEQGLCIAEALAEANEAPFSKQKWQDELAAYRSAGCPAVSHSEAYREAYRPAYRVLLQDLCVLLPILDSPKRVIVLDGPSCSGKSTLGGLLSAARGGTVIPMDDFFLPPEMRTPERLATPGGNIHSERFSEEVLEPLCRGKSPEWQRFDCATGELLPRRASGGLTVIEGSYSHHPAFDAAYRKLDALRVYVSCDAEEQRRRVSLRNPDRLEIFLKKWIPLEKTYFEAYDIPSKADVTLPCIPWEPAGLLR